jgi:hypothetical protein
VGDDGPWLRWHGLHGLSPEVEFGIDGRLIDDQRTNERVALRAAFSGGFFFGRLFSFSGGFFLRAAFFVARIVSAMSAIVKGFG